MTACVLGSQYIPSIEYFAHWLHHGTVCLDMHEHYPKRTWRNKTAILGPDYPLMLTVPLCKGKNQQMKITDVVISHDEPWTKNHINSIRAAYGKTAFFEEVIPGLQIIFDSPPSTLWQLNLRILHYLTSLIPFAWQMDTTSTFEVNYSSEVKDLRAGVPAGITSIPFLAAPEYKQVQRLFKPHQPNLSILDVLCHLGPDTLPYLIRYADKLYEKT
jgi:hypothetical protein